MYTNVRYLDKNCKDGIGFDISYLPSLYLPGIAASLIASPVTRKYGRKRSIIISGICFCLGVAVIAILPQIVESEGPDQFAIMIGRVIAGLGIGFGTQVYLEA